jgi:hypothetical protein
MLKKLEPQFYEWPIKYNEVTSKVVDNLSLLIKKNKCL